VQRPQSVSDVVRSLSRAALITFIALKLAGVVTWSWWWVLSPLWISGAPLALLAGGLVILWCLDRWPFTLVNPFYWRRRRQARLFLRFEPPLVPAACQNGAETTDIKRWPDDKETGSHQESSS
jgi:hypothetical protein